jgi:hypothetical protein
MNLLRSLCLATLASLLCASLSLVAQGRPSGYVGAETCKPCHDELYPSLLDSAHQKLFAETKPEKQGCEACHGPGKAHIDGNGDAAKIFRFIDARTPAVRSHCAVCHQDLSGDQHAHPQASCLTCHSVHHYQQKEFLLLNPASK